MTNKKKEYQEPTMAIVRVMKVNVLAGSPPPAEEPGGARQYDFDE
jgi:hypothetical protein